jgi:wyosine [tRNA(Phe)-imidazoG37] synthetase (radical SAM superfamily)
MKTVYGPVPSRRLGISLGIDPVSFLPGGRICSFDCIYCQLQSLGPLTYKTEREVFVQREDVERDLEEALGRSDPQIITFSGNSEPTLALNIGELAEAAKKMSGLPTAILTNSSLMPRPDVRKDLLGIGHVVAKLDAPDFETFRKVNRPAEGMRLGEIINSLRLFRSEYGGKLSLQMMFIKENHSLSHELAELAASIKPDEVQIDTPLRPSLSKPLSSTELGEIRDVFTGRGLNAVSIYELEKPTAKPIDMRETRMRRPVL